MTTAEKQSAIEALTLVLIEKIQQYEQYMKNDETFEVRKELRKQIRVIQKQIEELRESVDGQLR